MSESDHILRTSKLVRISSRDRSPGSKGQYDFITNFNDSFLHNVKRVLVKAIVCPNTSYNVNEFNNELVYNAGPGDETIIITPGQHSLTDLLDELVTAFAAEAVPQTMTYSVNTRTSRITMTFTNALVLKSGDNGSTMMTLLGGSKDTDTASQVSHLMPLTFDLTGLKKVYIGSNTLTTGTSMSSSNKQHKKIFTSIPITVPYGSIEKRTLSEYHTSDQITHSVPFNISTIDITLYDENLNLVDLNGIDFYMVLVALKD